MPLTNHKAAWRKVFVLITLIFSSAFAFAADGVTLHEFTKNQWYEQSYIWILAGSVLVLLILAFLSNNNLDKLQKD